MSEFMNWRIDADACQGPVTFDLSGEDLHLFREFAGDAVQSLQWIASIAGAPSADRDELDRAYRKLHYILGFCQMWKIEKAAQLLEPAEYAFEVGRSDGKFDRGSLDYVIRLSTGAAASIIGDLFENGSCDADVTAIVEECVQYIRAFDEARAQTLAENAPAVKVACPAPEDRPLPPVAPVESQEDLPGDFVEDFRPSAEQALLMEEFCAEARDNLARIGGCLIDLENAPGNLDTINELFRCVHTVKGGARLIGVRKLEMLAHEVESLLGDLRSGGQRAGASMIDVLIASNRALAEMVELVATRAPIATPIVALVKSINDQRQGRTPEAGIYPAQKQASGGDPVASAVARAAGTGSDDSLRVPTAKLDDVLNTASEVFVTRIRLQSDVAGLAQAVADLRKLVASEATVGARARLQRLRETISKLETALTASRGGPAYGAERGSPRAIARELMRALGEDDDNEAGANGLILGLEKVDLLRKQLQKDVLSMESLSSRLQSGAMNFRMVPVAHLFNRFPILVRDMARSLGKRVSLEIEGNTTELDKLLIGQLYDPLLHILRNAVDHGLETPDERLAAGKGEVGHIRLSAAYEGSYVILEIADDGRGLMTDVIASRAIERGLITAERAAQMSESEIAGLIFEPGFSTKNSVSEVSGRGVGMDVVKTAVQHMQGVVALDTTRGQSTIIRIRVPLTLAVVGVVLVEERGYHFAIPVLNITEIVSIPRGEMRDVGGVMAMSFRGRTLPLTSLSAVMDFPSSAFIDDHISVVVVNDGERELGVLVDRLLGRHDVLIKQFGSLLKTLPYLMGCTILSDSRLVGVLNVMDVVRHGKVGRAETGKPEQATRFVARRQHVILVVDDSAIQRHRLTAALERAGYRTVTAEDGFDALTKVKRKAFAACCVDVLMPIIDGFEFVERLRLLPEAGDTPVFMMSGRMIDHGFDQLRLDRLAVRGFFHKPFNVDDLVEELDRALLVESVVAARNGGQPEQREGMSL